MQSSWHSITDLFSELLPRCTAQLLDFSMELVLLQWAGRSTVICFVPCEKSRPAEWIVCKRDLLYSSQICWVSDLVVSWYMHPSQAGLLVFGVRQVVVSLDGIWISGYWPEKTCSDLQGQASLWRWPLLSFVSSRRLGLHGEIHMHVIPWHHRLGWMLSSSSYSPKAYGVPCLDLRSEEKQFNFQELICQPTSNSPGWDFSVQGAPLDEVA